VPTVSIPTAYRGPTQGEGQVLVSGESVRACLRAVDEKYPGFIGLVLDADGRVHRFVKLFVNGDQLAPGDTRALDAPLQPDDRVEVLAAIAGGRGARVRALLW
jgi:hypothetical protein